MKSQKESEVHLIPALEELATLRKEIRAFLGEEGNSITRNRIVFCLDELVSNIIEHAGLQSPIQKIHLKFFSFPSFWKFILLDDGVAFNPNSIESESWQDLYEAGAEGGYGLRAVKRLVYLHYKRYTLESKNQITLHFRKGKHE